MSNLPRFRRILKMGSWWVVKIELKSGRKYDDLRNLKRLKLTRFRCSRKRNVSIYVKSWQIWHKILADSLRCTPLSTRGFVGKLGEIVGFCQIQENIQKVIYKLRVYTLYIIAQNFCSYRIGISIEYKLRFFKYLLAKNLGFDMSPLQDRNAIFRVTLNETPELESINFTSAQCKKPQNLGN